MTATLHEWRADVAAIDASLSPTAREESLSALLCGGYPAVAVTFAPFGLTQHQALVWSCAQLAAGVGDRS